MPEIPSVLLLHGNDEFAIDGHIEKICASLGDPASADMNIARFNGRQELDFEALNSAVNAVPFLAPRRVMVLEHPIAAFNTPASRKILTDLLDKTPPTTTVILVEFEELKGEHWLIKWTQKAKVLTEVHIYKMPKRWEMPRWIESETKKLGGRIDPDAAALLAEMVGEDTRIASQELSKLITYVNFVRPINLLDVERVSIVSSQRNVFELVDALGRQEGKKAQHELHQLLEGMDANELWGMVIRQFRLLLQARELLDGNADNYEIQNALGLHEFVAQKVTNQAKQFSLPALESIYHKLLEIDEGAKTSQVPLDLALDMLIVELTR